MIVYHFCFLLPPCRYLLYFIHIRHPHDLCFSHLRPAFAVLLRYACLLRRHAFDPMSQVLHQPFRNLPLGRASSLFTLFTILCTIYQIYVTFTLLVWNQCACVLAPRLCCSGLRTWCSALSRIEFHHVSLNLLGTVLCLTSWRLPVSPMLCFTSSTCACQGPGLRRVFELPAGRIFGVL